VSLLLKSVSVEIVSKPLGDGSIKVTGPREPVAAE
jgi:hypothetical protein